MFASPTPADKKTVPESHSELFYPYRRTTDPHPLTHEDDDYKEVVPVKLEPRNLFTPSIAMGTSNQTKEYQDNSIVELGKESYQDDSNDPKPGKPTAA